MKSAEKQVLHNDLHIYLHISYLKKKKEKKYIKSTLFSTFILKIELNVIKIILLLFYCFIFNIKS